MEILNQGNEEINFSKEIYRNKKDREAIIAGFVLVLFNALLLAELINDEIIFAVIATSLALARIPIALWCSTIAKHKNRNSAGWAALGFFLPGITLIILAYIKKSNKANIEVTQFDKSKLSISITQNPNNLPVITLPTPTIFEIEALTNDSFTLKYMIKNYQRYIKETSVYFPLYVGVELNRRGEKFEQETIAILNKFSIERGFQSFNHQLESYNTQV